MDEAHWLAHLTKVHVGFCHHLAYTVQPSPLLFKDYRNAELTRSLYVYVDGPRNNMDTTDRTRCLHEAITDCNY